MFRTSLAPISPLVLPVAEVMPQVGCLSRSYSLCFFNGDQNLLGDGKLPHVAVSAFPLFLLPSNPSLVPLCVVLTRKVAQTHSAA